MNKVYTIGRDTSCDIVIPDSTDVVSRVHATLKVKGNGKYVLIDQSRNGTYVNGIKMSANEEIPVTRKDVISFAHVKDFDWNQIPKSKKPKMIWFFIAVVGIITASICYIIFKPKNEPVSPSAEKINHPVEKYDSTVIKDTTEKEAIDVKPQPKTKIKNEVKPTHKNKKVEKGKDKNKEKEKEKPTKNEPNVVSPLL